MMENVTENNKLIARFMGKKKYGEMGESWYFPENTIPDLGIYIYDEYLQFRTSWDWLMPVVEKITKIDITPAPSWTGYPVEIVPGGYVKITGFPMSFSITTNVSIEGSLIIATWKAVV